MSAEPESESDWYVTIPTGVFKLGAYAVAVYGILRAKADMRDHRCWPSHRTIAEESGVSERKVRAVLAELRDAGWIGWEQRKNSGGDLSSNVYTVHGTPRRGTASRAEPPASRAVPPTAPHAPRTAPGAEELLPRELQEELLSTAASADESEPVDPVEQTPPATEAAPAPVVGPRMTMADYRQAHPDTPRPPASGQCAEGKPCVCRDTGNTDVGACFAAFWFWWPGRKAQKRRAQDAFARAQGRGWPAATIVLGAQALSEDPNLPIDRQMIPLPAKWLDADGWLDDPYPPRTAPAAAGRPAAVATPIPPVFDVAAHRPADAVPMPTHLFDGLRRSTA